MEALITEMGLKLRLPAQIVSGGESEEKGKEGCKVVFPILADLSAGVFAKYSGILQKGCGKKLHQDNPRKRERRGHLSACSLLSPFPWPRFILHRAKFPDLPDGVIWLLCDHSGN